ncbi:MAG: DUF4115 domain-containing protein [Candidatus Zixiibacteriota bacterium]|nr:MAG: DUF4115 domain-containing protein [candidate division Zixibacteria bacterium]
MSELHKKFGELLKLERKRKGIKLEELSEQLKIGEANLRHIEEGEVASLPSQIYYNLFAKTYAETLGIDYQRTIEAIKEDIGEAVENSDTVKDAGPAREKESRPDSEARAEKKTDENGLSVKKLLFILGGIVAAFIVFIVIYLVFFASESADRGDTEPPAEPSSVTSTAASRPEQVEEQTEVEWDVTGYSEPEKMTLRLTARNQSWSTVLADGDTVIFRNLIPGRVYDVEAMYRMTVSVGIPSQVDVELNGQPVNLRDSITGRISRVEINQLNVDEILRRGTETGPARVTAPAPTEINRQEQSTSPTSDTATEVPVAIDSTDQSTTDREDNDQT